MTNKNDNTVYSTDFNFFLEHQIFICPSNGGRNLNFCSRLEAKSFKKAEFLENPTDAEVKKICKEIYTQLTKENFPQNPVLKVCIDPQCEEVAHNINKSEKRCRTCNGSMVEINKETYQKKFASFFFQYNYQTGKRTTPLEMGFVLQTELSL